MSVAVWITEKSEKETLLTVLQRHESLSRFADIHLLFGASNETFPINNLRNLAIRFARTPLVFSVDVDFLPSPFLSLTLR